MVLVLLAGTEILLYCPLLKISTDRCAVFLGQSGHRWQGVWCQGQSMKDTVVIAHCFIFFKHTVSTKLGEPYVKELMGLCLRVDSEGGRDRERGRDNMNHFFLFKV